MFNAADVAAFVQSKSGGRFDAVNTLSTQRSRNANDNRRHKPKQPRDSRQRSFMMPTLSQLVKRDGSPPFLSSVAAGSLAKQQESCKSLHGSTASPTGRAIGAFATNTTDSPEAVNKYSLHSPHLPQEAAQSTRQLGISPPYSPANAQKPIRLESNMPTYDPQALYNIDAVPTDAQSSLQERPLPPVTPRPATAKRIGGKPAGPEFANKSIRRYEIGEAEFATFDTTDAEDVPSLLPITSSSVSEAAQEVLLASKADDAARRGSLLPPKSMHGEGGEAALEDLRREVQAQADKVLHLQTRIAAEKLREQLVVEEKHSDDVSSKVHGYKSTFTVETSAALGKAGESKDNISGRSGISGISLSPDSHRAREMLSGVEKALNALEQGPIKRLQLDSNKYDDFAMFMADVHGPEEPSLQISHGDGSSRMAGCGTDKPWADKHASVSALLAAAERYVVQQPPPKSMRDDAKDKPRPVEHNADLAAKGAGLDPTPQPRFDTPITQSREHDRVVDMVRNTAREALNKALNTSGMHWPPQPPAQARAGRSQQHTRSSSARAVSPPRPRSVNGGNSSPFSSEAPMHRAMPRAHPPPSAVLKPEAWSE